MSFPGIAQTHMKNAHSKKSGFERENLTNSRETGIEKEEFPESTGTNLTYFEIVQNKIK